MASAAGLTIDGKVTVPWLVVAVACKHLAPRNYNNVTVEDDAVRALEIEQAEAAGAIATAKATPIGLVITNDVGGCVSLHWHVLRGTNNARSYRWLNEWNEDGDTYTADGVRVTVLR